MRKDKEWLKEAIFEKAWEENRSEYLIDLDSVNILLDQLEEPNVSNETVKDILKANKKMSKRIKELEDELESETNFYTFDDAKKWVEENGYIVTEKPVVPKFIANWIEFSKEKRPDYQLLDVLNTTQSGRAILEEDGRLKKFVDENSELFSKAYLFDCEVEKEKLYTVMFDGETYLKSNGKIVIGTGFKNKNDALTEKEIKDYDERFWQFAEPVEEETN